jgi:hypothetical protein
MNTQEKHILLPLNPKSSSASVPLRGMLSARTASLRS